MMYYIAGLCDKAKEYLKENTKFVTYTRNSERIGCKKSDGILNTDAKLYKIESVIETLKIPLFEYKLEDNKVYEVFQELINDVVFIALKIEDDKVIKWKREEIKDFIETFCNERE